LRLPIDSLELLANRHDVQVVHPLADRRFLAALAREGAAAGYGNRTVAMRALFGGLLPEAVLARPGKAEFGLALWGDESRAFAQAWGGEGVDSELVDADALRAAWAEPNPDFATATLLQGAWLAATRQSAPGAPPSPPAGSTTPAVGPA
jgi:asparagine synthase (glutamine-hydrolysing)